MVMVVSINGKITDEKAAHFPVISKAFLFGFSVFETIRTYNKKIFRLDDHLARLFLSVEIMKMKTKWSFKKVHNEIAKTLEHTKWSEMKIRVILTEKDLVIIAEKQQEKTSEMYKKGVKLISYEGKRTIPHAKKLADPFCYLAKQEALSAGVFEALLVDPKDYVRECAYANIFWVKKGEVYTTNKDILFGITRETVVEIVNTKCAEKECMFKGIKYSELLKADEIFITQTTSGILPIISIDDKKIGTGRPGKITKDIMKKFGNLVWDKN